MVKAKRLGKIIGWKDFTDPVFLIVLIIVIGIILWIFLPRLRKVKKQENFGCDMVEFFAGNKNDITEK